eukprot:CAMPEP_0119314186 /NCGR_PEP_ID=MMETSP1333-20130426/32001_1 /TAXON_ID=418940 /ORGANISM="Scyphosphaera apsteinii, Strain RCC1455" /LENGTH=321 /DNA_ID=CAMNT_0007319249 /DNA_START=85 /DNA_END=1050 /DNA_ORIENTATION=+
MEERADIERIPRPDGGSFPVRTVVLALLSVQSAIGLAGDRELGGVVAELSGQRPLSTDVDYVGSLLDAAFLAFCGTTILNQAGIISGDSMSKATLHNMECGLTLDIGRERGTWMPAQWAASGARLSLPMRVRFSDEDVDLGFGGEDAINPGGSRNAKKLYCNGGSFVGAQGETVVRVSGGAWSSVPSGIPGANTLNFFLDFPEEASRNDVTLPKGRIFFTSTYWESREALPDSFVDGTIELPDGRRVGTVQGPGGVYVLDQGGCSIKRNDVRNLWGALGDVMLILGRFSMSKLAAPAVRADETPQERAARERAEDVARRQF